MHVSCAEMHFQEFPCVENIGEPRDISRIEVCDGPGVLVYSEGFFPGFLRSVE